MVGFGLIALGIVIFFTLGSAVLIYLSKSIMHSAIALALAFFGGSISLLFAMQKVLALLQLLILVGGLSAYFIISFSLEGREEKNVKPAYFFLLVAITIIFFFSIFLLLGEPSAQPIGDGFLTSFGNAEGTGYYFLYVIAFAPFGAAIGGMLVVKRFLGSLK